MRKILYAKKTPPLYFSRLNQQATIAFMRNNSFFNISGRLREEPDYLFSNFYWTSAGSLKFSMLQYKGSTKTTFLANFAFGQHLKHRLIKTNFHTLLTTPTNLRFKGGNRYFGAFYKGFETDKKKLKIMITDITPLSLNGTKLRKNRRV